MAAEIQRMDHPALEVYRAFLNQGGGINLAVIDLENLRFVDFMAGIDAAKVNRLLSQSDHGAYSHACRQG